MATNWTAAGAEARRSAEMPPIRFAGIVGCIAFGAATMLYGVGVTFYSGRPVAELDLYDGPSITGAEPGIPAGRSAPWRVGPVALDPSMNPIRVILHSAYAGSYNGGAVGAAVALRDARGRRWWTGDCIVVPSCRSRRSGLDASSDAVLATFDLPRAGEYSFDVAIQAPSGDPTRRLTLEVRRGAATPRPFVIWAGIGAAVASILVGLVGGLFRRDEAGARA